MPYLFGYLNQDRDFASYNRSITFLANFSLTTFIVALILYVTDMRGNRILSLPENSQKGKDARKQMMKEFRQSVLETKGADEYYSF